MIQLILHLWGDYLLQSSWMAENKTRRWLPALVHATVYSLPFFLIGSWQAVLVIWSTHAVIDRFRLARYLCWAKNFIAPRWIDQFTPDPKLKGRWPALEAQGKVFGWEKMVRNYPWSDCSATGYPAATPVWLSTWLMIIADNTLHLTINFLALRYL